MVKSASLRNLLMASFVLLLFAGCSDIETVEVFDDSGRVLERYSQNKKTGLKEGKYEAFFPDGTLKETCFYKNDTLDGKRTLYYENGQVDAIENYKNGNFEGLFQKYFQNGQLSNEGQYVNNEMTGIWKRWYDTGELREEVNFEHNLENGPYKFYHKNGQVSVQGSFIQGDNDHGEVLKYDENGQLIEKMYCHWGVCATTWTLAEGDIKIDSARIKDLGEKNRFIIERDLQ
ncbi:MAG: hypothetical protein CMN32_04040 [Saprospirales bacterium]|nr:hypothetical protein [Saprospirales bacterium]